MNTNEKFRLEQQTKRNYWLLRFKTGCKAILSEKDKRYIIVAYVMLALVLWGFRVPIFGLGDGDIFGHMKRTGFENLFPVCFIAGLLFLIALFGMPFGGKSIHDNLRRIGFVNSAGETPLLVATRNDKDNPHVEILEFEANGIPLTEWENKRDKLEAALNVHTVKITEGANKRRILLYTVPAHRRYSQMLYWRENYLINDSFVLVLGESLIGQITVNLAQIPHILLGGSTGSGKSVLLKLLLMQCVKKGATVYIADFKGGVDFPIIWHENCRIVMDEDSLLKTLSGIVDELERRKQLLKYAECPNIDAFNSKMDVTFPRIVFACDEVAEVLDKNGLSKEDKERISKIENRLSTIARQGRAFGIHLILATQRPDATILSGQIRNNIDYRVCGRADDVLSQIILDNTAASEQIPKDAQGRFLTHDGTVFQGYLFDEKTAFDKGGGAYEYTANHKY